MIELKAPQWDDFLDGGGSKPITAYESSAHRDVQSHHGHSWDVAGPASRGSRRRIEIVPPSAHFERDDRLAEARPASPGDRGEFSLASANLIERFQFLWLRRRVSELESALEKAAKSKHSFGPARRILDDLARLPDDWDSYGAARLTAISISTAHGLLARLAEDYAGAAGDIALPWATAPLADGGVQFEWRGPGGAIEVEIGPEGLLNFLVERDETTIARSHPGDIVTEFEVLEHLRRVLGF